jgi:hypothetical protein
MEALLLQPVRKDIIEPVFEELSSSKPFIESNTISCSLEEIRNNHIIPTYRDNTRLIATAEFIDTTYEIVKKLFPNETILAPNIRVSHPVRGRIPEAKHKHVSELLENETTVFFERTCFIIEIPSIQADVAGNTLSLTVAGIKSYQKDNVNGKENSNEHFQIAIGFLNKICSNGNFWLDGYSNEVAVKSLSSLHALIHSLVERYNSSYHLHHLRQLSEVEISEQEFAMILGKMKMYQYLPQQMKNKIKPMLLGDSQINTVVKQFYLDENFHRESSGGINLFNFYNLITGSLKSAYIDSYLEKHVSSFHLIEDIRFAKHNKSESWYLA